MTADVRFSNHTTNTQVILAPQDGNKIAIYDPVTGTWSDEAIPLAGITADVTSCFIDDVAAQNMAYSTLHLSFLKKNAGGNRYLNFLPWSLAGSVKNADGIFVDARTQHGHMVGMLIRMPTFELQGQTNSEYVLSYYKRGNSNFVSVPAGTVAAASGWQNVGDPVELLIWADAMPKFDAIVNFKGNTANAEMSARVLVTFNDANGHIGSPNNWGYETGATNAIVGKAYNGAITGPLASAPPGFWRFQMQISVDVGTVTLGSGRNSMMSAYGKF